LSEEKKNKKKKKKTMDCVAGMEKELLFALCIHKKRHPQDQGRITA
jgi:hypothetical protein